MISWFARNHVAANLLMMAIILFGVLALKKDLALEFLPDFKLGSVTISTLLPGGSPKSIESTVTSRIEEAIADIQGIKKVVSISSENISQVIAEIETNYDEDTVLSDIKVRVDALNTLPSSAERPQIKLAELNVQVIGIALWGDVDFQHLYKTTEQLRQALINTDGVTQVGDIQAPAREIHIEISPDTLKQYGVGLEHVANAIRQNSLDISAGSLRTEEGDILIRANQQAYSVEQFAQIPVIRSGDQVVYLGDIATIIDGFELLKVETQFNEKPSLTFEVYRIGTESTLNVANTTLDFLDNYSLPEGIQLTTYGNTADVVKERLDTLVSSAIQGGLLVLILLSLFLRPAVALWVGIGIPVCFLGSFALMPELGLSLNMLSMFAYILVLGIVVDDAIVTAENIYRHTRLGMSPAEAAIYGTKEVAVPVTFGVVTTMVAFIPLLIINGAFSTFAKQIPLVVIPVLLFSLIESKLILPAHMSTIVPRGDNFKSVFSKAQQAFSRGFENAILIFYRPLLHLCIKNKTITLLLAICLFITTITSMGFGWLKLQFFPNFDDNAIIVTLVMPSTTGYETTKGHIQNISDIAKDIADEHRDPQTKESYLKNIFTVSGLNFGGSGAPNIGPNKGLAYIELKTIKEGLPNDFSIKELQEKFRQRIGVIPGALKLQIASSLSGFGRPISITLYSDNQDLVKEKVLVIKEYLKNYPGVFDIQDTIFNGKEEINFSLTPLAHSLGLAQIDIANQVRSAIFGIEAQRLQRNNRDIKVMVRYPEQHRNSLPDLSNIAVHVPRSNKTIPLSDLVDLHQATSPSSIYHDRLRRSTTINADLDKQNTDANVLRADLQKFLKKELGQYPDLTYTMDGEAEAEQETFADFMLGFVIVILGIYALLAIPFKSFGQPFVVMSIIPLAISGAIWGHYFMGIPFSVLSIMGILGLTGIVVNDSLVLVDYINQQRAKGQKVIDAVLTAGETRFRPVMLTSLTTFVGLLPLMLNTSPQARALVPMAISLGFGIIFATFITLLITPITYLAGRSIKHRILGIKEE